MNHHTALSRLRRALPRAQHIAVAAAAMLMAACASIGNPSGGPRDEDAPRFVRSNPAPGARNFSGHRINIEFDEIVNVKDAMTKVVVSPPSKTIPRVSSQGRRVTVEFRDTLLPDATYTIDFSNSIEDNNEGNKLQGYTFTFSTGAEIDTLRLSGMVFDALTMEAQQGMLVGVHTNPADSAFVKTRFDRVAKTDDRGRFTIYGLAPGEYRVYALNDMDGDMQYANPEEDLAFTTVLLSPTSERVMTTDTIFDLRTGDVDSVVSRMRTRFLPNDILLRSFNSGRRQQFIEKYERPDSARIVLRFNTKASLPPVIDFPEQWGLTDGIVTERNATNDTITYWLPPALSAIDTLRMAVGYHRLDSLSRPEAVHDTLRLTSPVKRVKKDDAKKEAARSKKKEKSDSDADLPVKRESPMTVMLSSGTSQEVYLPMTLTFARPVSRVDSAGFRLEQKVDTLWYPVTGFTLSPVDTLSHRRMTLAYPWEYETQYRVTVDSLAVTDIYGFGNDPWMQEVTAKPENEYSSLTLTLKGLSDTIPAYVDLLNTSESVVRRAPVVGGRAYMPYLPGGKYYARVVLDRNGDGDYTPGDFELQRQPDLAFYCPRVINVRKNWDAEQEWDVFVTPVNEMKPYAIRKNRPERAKGEKDPAETQEEEEERLAEEEAKRTGNYNPFESKSKLKRR